MDICSNHSDCVLCKAFLPEWIVSGFHIGS
jgi:hypothetical protein